MAAPTLIYCADGNKRFAQIATEAGFLYGAQLPNSIYHLPVFIDQKWRSPDRPAYMDALAKYNPAMATVLDWERDEQLPEVLSWAEEVAQYTEGVVIIPKIIGGIAKLPRRIGGVDVILGYSVKTKFAGTPTPLWEFHGWPIHLLGGSPKKQRELWYYLRGKALVVSADGNMHLKMANKYCAFFTTKRIPGVKNHPWPTLAETGARWGDGTSKADAPYEAFRRSCENIMAMWRSA